MFISFYVYIFVILYWFYLLLFYIVCVSTSAETTLLELRCWATRRGQSVGIFVSFTQDFSHFETSNFNPFTYIFTFIYYFNFYLLIISCSCYSGLFSLSSFLLFLFCLLHFSFLLVVPFLSLERKFSCAHSGFKYAGENSTHNERSLWDFDSAIWSTQAVVLDIASAFGSFRSRHVASQNWPKSPGHSERWVVAARLPLEQFGTLVFKFIVAYCYHVAICYFWCVDSGMLRFGQTGCSGYQCAAGFTVQIKRWSSDLAAPSSYTISMGHIVILN